jgi:predicted transcriptional regulator of viral defense system
MKALNFINELRAQGRFSFNVSEAEKALGLKKVSCLNALHRLKKGKWLVSPARGFYLIVPPEYQAYGCLPADMFISDLMRYWRLPYYVGFLSAAQYYGAAHQKPQRFQVVTLKNRPSIHCGRIHIEFIRKKQIDMQITKQFNTLAGTIQVASPELLAFDLVSKPEHAAGMNNVATILSDLIESLDGKKLAELTQYDMKLFGLQRLGWLIDYLESEGLTQALFSVLESKILHWVRLVSHVPYEPLERNKKWHVIVNTSLEMDE